MKKTPIDKLPELSKEEKSEIFVANHLLRDLEQAEELFEKFHPAVLKLYEQMIKENVHKSRERFKKTLPLYEKLYKEGLVELKAAIHLLKESEKIVVNSFENAKVA